MSWKISAVIAAFMLLPSLITAKTYTIPPHLKEDVCRNMELFNEEPTSNNRKFELAMSYGYTGQIEKGWNLLKEIPPTFAPTVVEKYERLTVEEANDWRHNFKLAFGYYFIERKEDAKQQFQQVLDKNPGNVWAMGFTALLLGEQNKNQEAIEWCKRALAKEPNATAIHFLLAEGYRRTGNYLGSLMEMMVVGRLKTEEAAQKKNDC